MLSIITPVYNTADYLCVTVNSILAQTYRDFELILVDDGSTDGSGELCDRLAAQDDRVRVIHKPNGGVASARNAGLDAVCGDYIGWVDSDDLISPVMFETMLKLAARHNADIVQCSHVRNPEKLETEYVLEDNLVEILDGIGTLKRIYRSHYTNALALWSKIYRKKLFEGIRFTEGTAFEDDEMVPRVLERSGVSVFCEKPLYCYVKRESSIITSPKVENIVALTTHLENRMLRYRELDQELYNLGRKHLFVYLKSKYNFGDCSDTPVSEQAEALLLKYCAEFRRDACRADKLALCLLHCGKIGKHILKKTDFEPIQRLFQKIRGKKDA